MRNKNVEDTRNILDLEAWKKTGFSMNVLCLVWVITSNPTSALFPSSKRQAL
jgi:hypothetical protein